MPPPSYSHPQYSLSVYQGSFFRSLLKLSFLEGDTVWVFFALLLSKSSHHFHSLVGCLPLSAHSSAPPSCTGTLWWTTSPADGPPLQLVDRLSSWALEYPLLIYTRPTSKSVACCLWIALFRGKGGSIPCHSFSRFSLDLRGHLYLLGLLNTIMTFPSGLADLQGIPL